MNQGLYLFCIDYHFNHIISGNHNIGLFCNRYERLLKENGFVDYYFSSEGKYYKRLYTNNIETALKIQNDNINYCETVLKVDKIYKEKKIEKVIEEEPIKKRKLRKL